MESIHKFQCTCGKVNQFKIVDSPKERNQTVRCGSCGQLCRMLIPGTKPKSGELEDMINKILGGRKFPFDP